jgi:hypothetical protein
MTPRLLDDFAAVPGVDAGDLAAMGGIVLPRMSCSCMPVLLRWPS